MPNAPSGGAGLNKRVAGVPLKWWALGGVAGVGVVYYVYKRGSATPTAPVATDPSIDPQTGIPYADESGMAGGYSALPGYGGGYGGVATGGGTTDVGATDFPTGAAGDPIHTTTDTTVHTAKHDTNLAWLQHAEAVAVKSGYAHPASALSAYLIGMPLAEYQADLVRHVVAMIGPPPQGAPAIHLLPHQGQKKAAKPPAKKHAAPAPPKKKKNPIHIHI